jgi:hypothetical protein
MLNFPGFAAAAALGVFFLGMFFFAGASIVVAGLGVIALLGAVVCLFDTDRQPDITESPLPF